MHTIRSTVAAFLAFMCIARAAAAGDELNVDASLDLRQPNAGGAQPAEEPRRPFGAQGQEHLLAWSGAGFGLESEDATDVPGTFGYSRFIADDIEFSAELTLWGHFQDGDDAAGINPGFNLRWHFLNRDTWTLFADAGVGVLASTDDVPDGGTSFNFTPRAGGGATLRITDGGVRLIGGVRWHHISNARIEGEENNPDRDGILVYGGLVFPF